MFIVLCLRCVTTTRSLLQRDGCSTRWWFSIRIMHLGSSRIIADVGFSFCEVFFSQFLEQFVFPKAVFSMEKGNPVSHSDGTVNFDFHHVGCCNPQLAGGVFGRLPWQWAQILRGGLQILRKTMMWLKNLRHEHVVSFVQSDCDLWQDPDGAGAVTGEEVQIDSDSMPGLLTSDMHHSPTHQHSKKYLKSSMRLVERCHWSSICF